MGLRSPDVLQMAELVRTNDPGIISVIEGLLGGADVPYQVTDRNMSILEGSISAIQIRILVPEERAEEARELLIDGRTRELATSLSQRVDGVHSMGMPSAACPVNLPAKAKPTAEQPSRESRRAFASWVPGPHSGG